MQVNIRAWVIQDVVSSGGFSYTGRVNVAIPAMFVERAFYVLWKCREGEHSLEIRCESDEVLAIRESSFELIYKNLPETERPLAWVMMVVLYHVLGATKKSTAPTALIPVELVFRFRDKLAFQLLLSLSCGRRAG